MGCKSAVALVRGVEYLRNKACSTAQGFLRGVFWKDLAHFQLLQNGFRWLCYHLTSSAAIP